MPTFYLVVDEVVPHCGCQFRVRMWRQAGQPPLVLFSQVPGHPLPNVGDGNGDADGFRPP